MAYGFSENDRMPEKSEGLRTSCIQIKDDKNLLYLYRKYFTHLRIWKMKRAQMRRRLK